MALNLPLIKRIGLLFKKSAGKAKARQTAGDGAAVDERKIGIFGHRAAGKTVFWTMLWHQTHRSRDFQLQTDDLQTRKDMSDYYELLAHQREWPPPTTTERCYRFTAQIHSTLRYPFESQDFPGEILSLDNELELTEKLMAYFEGCDCVFILVDAEDLLPDQTSAALRERKIGTFEVLLARLTAGTQSKLKVPIAIIITKADLLDGFGSEEQVQLVSDSISYSRYRGYADFTSAVLQQKSVAKNLAWRDSVEHVLMRLQPVIDYCLPKSPDLQIFFVSATGSVERPAPGEGERVPRPPAELKPLGLDKPFLWAVPLLMWKRRAGTASRVKWWIAAACLAFLIPILIANHWHHGRMQRLDRLFGESGGSVDERVESLESYRDNTFANLFKSDFKTAVRFILPYVQADRHLQKMTEAIANNDLDIFGEAVQGLDGLLRQMDPNSDTYRAINAKMADKKRAWDEHRIDTVLDPEISRARTPQEMAALEDKARTELFTPDIENEFLERVRRWQDMDIAERRESELETIAERVGGLRGTSWATLVPIQGLIKSYLENFRRDQYGQPEERQTYQMLSDIDTLLTLAAQAQGDRNELEGIASSLQGLGAVGGHRIGRTLGGYLLGLRMDSIQEAAPDALAQLASTFKRKPWSEKYSQATRNELAQFVRKWPGTPQATQVDDLLSNIDRLEERGLMVRLRVTAIDPAYHLRIWDDHTFHGYSPTSLELNASTPYTMSWKPGNAIKIGFERNTPNPTEDRILAEWSSSDRWALMELLDEGGRIVFESGGSVYPVTIEFLDLERDLPGLE